ncbi:MAG: branched-chain amino acid ABC transporter permease [Leifsonia sp.]|nr:branched-chain amino acid ABC transporter permease [Leifsonia sp.]
MTGEVLIQQLFNALSIGSIYALLALGLAVVFSLLGLLNFAYGEIITITSYSMVVLVATGVPLLAAAPIAIVAGILISMLTELVAFRPLRHAPVYAVVFSSFAVSLLIQSLIRNVISPRPQGLAVPAWLDYVIDLGGVRFPALSVVTIVVAVLAMLGLTAMLQKSRHGLAIRAAAEDFQATRLMGAQAGRLILMAFAISGALAGIAGVLYIAKTGSATPDMGFNPLLQAFVAVVLGGMGSLRGAVAAGFALAFVEVALQVFLPREFVPYVQAITLVVIIVVLYFRPQGFARRIEERVA